MKLSLLPLICLSLILSCSPTQEGGKSQSSPNGSQSLAQNTMPQSYFDLQGHRGCRGLMPENTLPAFMHALDLGVTTLELDVVITADSEVLVSHEPFFSHEICLDPDGKEIPEAEEKKHNIFSLSLAECQQYDCGSREVKRFPKQQKLKVHKPSLREVFTEVEAYLTEQELPPVNYNIETKCTPEGDGVFHPDPQTFARLLHEVIQAAGTADRVSIQSFDVRTLQYAHEQNWPYTLVLLIEEEDSPQTYLDQLGFTPDVYSPWFKLVDKNLAAFCQEKNMKLIPWTVNEPSDIQAMLDLGVDGIISDYPDRVQTLPKK